MDVGDLHSNFKDAVPARTNQRMSTLAPRDMGKTLEVADDPVNFSLGSDIEFTQPLVDWVLSASIHVVEKGKQRRIPQW